MLRDYAMLYPRLNAAISMGIVQALNYTEL